MAPTISSSVIGFLSSGSITALRAANTLSCNPLITLSRSSFSLVRQGFLQARHEVHLSQIL